MSVLSFAKMPLTGDPALEPLGPWPIPLADRSSRLRKLARRIVRTFALAMFEHRMRKAARELQRFDDRLLRDIGLNRGEIDHMVRYGRPGAPSPFAGDWQAWSSAWPAPK